MTRRDGGVVFRLLRNHHDIHNTLWPKKILEEGVNVFNGKHTTK